MLGWNGRWVFTESGELVAPKAISRYDLSKTIYGPIKPDSKVYDLLGFKRTSADEVGDLKKTVSKEKLDALFESELMERFGISVAELDAHYGRTDRNAPTAIEERLPFPSLNVKSWDALKKHAVEMLTFADPTIYSYRLRSVRVSNHQQEARAYTEAKLRRYRRTQAD